MTVALSSKMSGKTHDEEDVDVGTPGAGSARSARCGTLAMPWRLLAVSWTTATGRRSVSRVKPLFLASLWNAGLEVATALGVHRAAARRGSAALAGALLTELPCYR